MLAAPQLLCPVPGAAEQSGCLALLAQAPHPRAASASQPKQAGEAGTPQMLHICLKACRLTPAACCLSAAPPCCGSVPEEGTAGDLQLFSHQKLILGSEGSSWKPPGCSALVGPSCPFGVEGKAGGVPPNPKFLLEERPPEAGCPPQSQGHLRHSRHLCCCWKR